MHHCRLKLAHISQSRPDSCLGLQVKVLQTLLSGALFTRQRTGFVGVKFGECRTECLGVAEAAEEGQEIGEREVCADAPRHHFNQRLRLLLCSHWGVRYHRMGGRQMSIYEGGRQMSTCDEIRFRRIGGARLGLRRGTSYGTFRYRGTSLIRNSALPLGPP